MLVSTLDNRFVFLQELNIFMLKHILIFRVENMEAVFVTSSSNEEYAILESEDGGCFDARDQWKQF